MVEFIIGASGTGKTTELFERIKTCQCKERVVLVPEQYSTEFDKKLYKHIGAKDFNSLLSLSFSSLARQLFQMYGETHRKGEYADDMARLIMTYQAVKEAKNSPDQLLFFRKGASQAGFAEDMLKLIGDMKSREFLRRNLWRKRIYLKRNSTTKLKIRRIFIMNTNF
jgi:ATP-dependent helicase/nuclease subunit B